MNVNSLTIPFLTYAVNKPHYFLDNFFNACGIIFLGYEKNI